MVTSSALFVILLVDLATHAEDVMGWLQSGSLKCLYDSQTPATVSHKQ